MTKFSYSYTFFALFSLISYLEIAQTPRTHFFSYFACITFAFLCYFLAIRFLPIHEKKQLYWGIAAAIAFRFVVTFCLPQLSDDFYRFVWDGKIVAHGANPFLFQPSELIQLPQAQLYGLSQTLFSQLNSPNYYTIYPPVCQAVMGVSCFLFPENLWTQVVCMKVFILLSEAGSIVLLYHLLAKWDLPARNLFLYAWNPLVIVEFCGNLHFEAFMVFFLLLTVYFLAHEKIYKAAVFMAFAICSKLLPLILFPFLINRIGLKKTFLFGISSLLLTLFLFLPFLKGEMLSHFFASSKLYFQTFEFNASIYYLVRWLGFQMVGYNILFIIGKFIPFFVIIGILWKSNIFKWFSKEIEKQEISTLWSDFLFAFTLYFVFATTVNPWYIAPLVMFSIFTKQRFPLIWTFLLPLTYFTYYQQPYQENLWLTCVEYGGVFFFAINEKLQAINKTL